MKHNENPLTTITNNIKTIKDNENTIQQIK